MLQTLGLSVAPFQESVQDPKRGNIGPMNADQSRILMASFWGQCQKTGSGGPPTPGPANIWGNGGSNPGRESRAVATPQAPQDPRRATAGSAGLDLRATTRLILTPQMGVQIIESDFRGPLQPGTVGVLIGRSPTALRGLRVHPGVIDPDYTGIVKIMVESPRGITAISPGDRIAQLIILPSLHDQFAAKDVTRGDKGFGSTGNDLTFLSLDLDQRPTLQLAVNGTQITGLLDTGADKSIIASKDWPQGWPIQKSSHTLQGLGYASAPDISTNMLTWKDAEGHSGLIQPYVLDLPTTLWGRYIMTKMGIRLSNKYSEKAQAMMREMGSHPSFGLGRFLQGHTEPILPQPRTPKQGLGFS